MKSTREAFGDELIDISKNNKDIIVMTADLKKATSVDKFAKIFPDRFFQVGIAEANMIGIASGLSEYRFKVFITSFASFITGRYDILRCSIAYSKAPVIIVGTHGGMAIGKDGVTQMGLEDISLMRSLPNMTVLNPSTYSETREMVKYLGEHNLENPCYLRLGRQPVEDYLENYFKFHEFCYGKGLLVKNGKDLTMVSTGCILSDVIKSANMLEEKCGVSVRVININTIKPIDKEIIIKCAKETNNIVTIEDHSIIGGLGSTVADVLCEYFPKKILKIGLNDIFPESGEPNHLYEKYGLSVNKIFERVKNELLDK